MTTQVAETRGGPEPVRCANCRITLRAEPVIAGGRAYCCDGCASGGPCCC